MHIHEHKSAVCVSETINDATTAIKSKMGQCQKVIHLAVNCGVTIFVEYAYQIQSLYPSSKSYGQGQGFVHRQSHRKKSQKLDALKFQN